MVIFELPRAPEPTHKTRNITAIEWRRLFTADEQFALDELQAMINDMSYEVPGSNASLDSPAAALGISATYRKFLRTCFNAAKEVQNNGNGIDVEDDLAFPSLICFEALGILADGRKEVIIQGVPL